MKSFIEIPKLVRAALRKTFPGAKFSVTSDNYNGITIHADALIDGEVLDDVPLVVPDDWRFELTPPAWRSAP